MLSSNYIPLRSPFVQTHNAPVSCIHFSATAPHDFAVTCSTHVSLHAAATGRQIRSVGRFDHVAYSAQLRSDGKLMGTGDHTGTVKARRGGAGGQGS